MFWFVMSIICLIILFLCILREWLIEDLYEDKTK